MGWFVGLSAVGVVGLLASLFLPDALGARVTRLERAPWLTLPGVAGGLAAVGIVGGLVLDRADDLVLAVLLGLAAGAAAVAAHAWLTSRIEGSDSTDGARGPGRPDDHGA